MHITLAKKAVERTGDHWVVKVAVKFTNTGKKVFQLDKLTAALDGQLANDVFTITSAKGPVEYRGMMETTVDLGADYGFPAAGGTFRVKFSSANHFSVDDVQLESGELELVLPL